MEHKFVIEIRLKQEKLESDEPKNKVGVNIDEKSLNPLISQLSLALGNLQTTDKKKKD